MLYSRCCGVTTAVTPAAGSPAGQKVAVGPDELLPLLLSFKSLIRVVAALYLNCGVTENFIKLQCLITMLNGVLHCLS